MDAGGVGVDGSDGPVGDELEAYGAQGSGAVWRVMGMSSLVVWVVAESPVVVRRVRVRRSVAAVDGADRVIGEPFGVRCWRGG